jgi:transcriptional regulator with XRE-family HTH domain
MKINEKIKVLRLKASMTQEQLANKIGVSAQSVSKWEKGISMPDITLLPFISEVFGVSIDDLFDLTVDEKLKRIENRIEIESEFSPDVFKEYESFLHEQLGVNEDKARIYSLLANLYHHRMESDSKKVSRYGREAILLDPTKKECQWLLAKAEGHAVWDWNVANHSSAIDFYKKVIELDKGTPKSSMPYYYLIDNLLADNRTSEAEAYLKEFAKLPSANPVMIEAYEAYIAFLNHDVVMADEIINSFEINHPDDWIYLFEAAQYYAVKCDYKKAIQLYEKSWVTQKTPRMTDAQEAIAIINKILGNKNEAKEAYEKILVCLKEEWGYSKEDFPYIETERKMLDLLK